MNPLHICYSLHDATGSFSKFVATSMESLMANTEAWVEIHLLHDNTLTEALRSRFITLVRSHGNMIRFHNVEELAAEELGYLADRLPSLAGTRLSAAAMYRLLLPKVISPDIVKVIYLDADTIINLDINDLWQENMEGSPLAAVSEQKLTHGNNVGKYLIDNGYVEAARYFNSGILVIDLHQLRQKENLWQEGIELLREHPECNSADQDILNYFYAGSYKELPLHYDVFCDAERLINNFTINEAIYHYAGVAVDPFDDDAYNRLFFKYFIKTPWFNEDFLMGAFVSAKESVGVERNYNRRVFNQVGAGKRTLYGLASNEAALRRLFQMTPQEKFIDIGIAGNKYDVGVIIKELKENPDTLAVICYRGYKLFTFIAMQLQKAGFQEYRHFVDGTLLIPEKNGGRANDSAKFLFRNM